jgi:hypothetical protein
VNGQPATGTFLAMPHPREAKQTADTKKKSMNRTSRTMIAGAAVAGLLTGSFAVRAHSESTSSKVGVSLQTAADTQKGKHGCKGQNECKGQGGCKNGDNGCKGKNSCKGKGGCKSSESSCKGKNGCSLQSLVR